MIDNNTRAQPRAFLSYGSEDRELANKIAEILMAKGIETWRMKVIATRSFK